MSDMMTKVVHIPEHIIEEPITKGKGVGQL